MDDAADENEMKAIIAGIRKSGSKRFLEKTHGKNTNALFSIWDGRISLMHASPQRNIFRSAGINIASLRYCQPDKSEIDV